MRGSHCIFNSAVALRTVFINGPAATESLGQLALQRVFLPSLGSAQRRWHGRYTASRTFGPQAVADSKNEGAFPRDDNITSPFVLIRDEATGKLSAPQRPWDVLGQLNLAEQSLVMVMDPARLKSSALKYPVCRIVDRKAERAAQQAKEKEKESAGKSSVKEKEVELNWAIAPNDLERALNQLRTFLEKGYAVQVRLMKKMKRGKRAASDDEIKAVFKRVQDTIKKIPGVKQTKSMEGVMGRQIRLFLQGAKVAEQKPVAQEGGEVAA
jgi:translation initiation factor IF-3